MKCLVIITALTMCLSCKRTFVGSDGRVYEIKATCIQSHRATHLVPHHIGKNTIYIPQPYTVCDKYKYDTILSK